VALGLVVLDGLLGVARGVQWLADGPALAAGGFVLGTGVAMLALGVLLLRRRRAAMIAVVGWEAVLLVGSLPGLADPLTWVQVLWSAVVVAGLLSPVARARFAPRRRPRGRGWRPVQLVV
jgi:hypothetical protein